MEYTKGEWVASVKTEREFHANLQMIVGDYQKEQGGCSVICYVNDLVQEAEANANLIVQAPRMVELLLDMTTNGWNATIHERAEEIIQTLDLS